MLVGSALLAIAALVIGLLASASESTWSILIAATTLLLVVGWLVRLERVMKAAGASGDEIATLRAQCAILEARQCLVSQAGTIEHNLWEDAVSVFAGAIIGGCTLSYSTKNGQLVPSGLTSPREGGRAITWTILLPLTREHVNSTATFAIAHGAPLARLDDRGIGIDA